MAGYMLGKIRLRDDNADLSLREAARNATILGSPALARTASECLATFSVGCTQGFVTATAAANAASVGIMLADIAAGVAAASSAPV